MTTVTTRRVKGSELTWDEMDDNFDGLAVNSITTYDTFAAIPPVFSGVAKVGHSLYTGNGDLALEIPYLNSDGELVANIVPRTDTLNNLLLLTGSTGELASATDASVIVKYKGGTTVGGDIFTTNGGAFGAPAISTAEIALNIDTTLYPDTMDIMSFNTGFAFSDIAIPTNTLPIIGFYNKVSGAAIISFDSINYSKLAPPLGIACNYAIANNMIFAVPVASTGTVYIAELANNFSSWVPLTVPTGVYKPPMVVSLSSVALTLTTSSNVVIVIDLYVRLIDSVTLPATGVWVVQAQQFDVAGYSHFIVYRTTSATQNIYQIFGTPGTFTFYDTSIPVALNTSSKIAFTRNQIVVLNLKQIYCAPYISNGSIIRITWSLSKLNTTLDSLVRIKANENVFFMMDVRNFYYSLDGVSWLDADTKDTISSTLGSTSSPFISALSTGCLVYNGSEGSPIMCFSSINTYSISSSRGFSYIDSTIVSSIKACNNTIVSRPIDGSPDTGVSCVMTLGGFNFVSPKIKTNSATATPINLSRSEVALLDKYATTRVSTIYLPPVPVHGQTVRINTKNGFSATSSVVCFVNQGASYGTVNGTASYALTLAAGTSKLFTYDLTTNDWSVG